MAAMYSRTVAAALFAALATVAGCNVTTAPDPVIESSAPPSPHVTRELVGPGCDTYLREYPTGRGSAAAVARQSASAALAAHPDLNQFARAIGGQLNTEVDLTAALNAGRYTIFAPTDSAIAKLPPTALDALAAPESASALTDLLRAHVVQGRLSPTKVAGDHETLDGEPISISATGDRIRVDGQVNVICGGLRTANAIIYVIDGVLMPESTDSDDEDAEDAADEPSPTTEESP